MSNAWNNELHDDHDSGSSDVVEKEEDLPIAKELFVPSEEDDEENVAP